MFDNVPNCYSKNFTEKSAKGLGFHVFLRKNKIMSQNELKCRQTVWKFCEKYVFQIEFEISTVVLELSR